MAIFSNFSPTLSRLHPLQVENCDSNSRLVAGVVDGDDNDKFRLERVKLLIPQFKNDYNCKGYHVMQLE